MTVFSTSHLIQEIRDYQTKNSELLEKSHHFVFDCPFKVGEVNKPGYVWMGLNPGSDLGDWEKTHGQNDEESRDRDFQEIFSRSRGSKTRQTKIKKFLGEEIFKATTLTEVFFWCSKNLQDDFKMRYGTGFQSSPHLEFCLKMNRKLFDLINPKAIFFESLPNIDILRNFFFLEKIDFYNVGTRRIDEWMIDGKYRLLNFDHLSSGPPASLERTQVSEMIRRLILEK